MSEPFDTRESGTPEQVWEVALKGVPAWAPVPGPLVVVAPHPDDETLGAGGLLHDWALAGHPIIVVVVTDGEAARPELHHLADIRVKELHAALSELAPQGVSVHRLSLPDGRVHEQENYLARLLEVLVPLGSTLVAPFEEDGHIDHNATGRACWAVARKLGVTLVRYPIWAWHRLTPAEFGGAPMGSFRLSVDAQAAKRRAMKCFVSQLESRDEGAVVPAHVLTHFTRPYEVYLV